MILPCNCCTYILYFRTVRENLRVIMTCTSLGEAFQKRCRALPALTNTVSIILMPHWSKEGLVSHASYHLKSKSRYCHPLLSQLIPHQVTVPFHKSRYNMSVTP